MNTLGFTHNTLFQPPVPPRKPEYDQLMALRVAAQNPQSGIEDMGYGALAPDYVAPPLRKPPVPDTNANSWEAFKSLFKRPNIELGVDALGAIGTYLTEAEKNKQAQKLYELGERQFNTNTALAKEQLTNAKLAALARGSALADWQSKQGASPAAMSDVNTYLSQLRKPVNV